MRPMYKAYEIDTRGVRGQLDALPLAVRMQVEVRLSQIAQFAGLTPPPSAMFLRLEGIDPESVFRFEIAGLRVNYEVDTDGRVVRALKVATAAAALKFA